MVKDVGKINVDDQNRWKTFIQDTENNVGLDVAALPNVSNLLCNLEENLKIQDDDEDVNHLREMFKTIKDTTRFIRLFPIVLNG